MNRPAGRRKGFQGSMRLGALFLVLIGINMYVFFFRGGTSIRDVLKASAIQRKLPAASSKDPRGDLSRVKNRTAPRSNDSIVVQGSLKGQIGLSSALENRNIDMSEISGLINVLKSELNMRSLRPKHTFEAHLDPTTKKIRRFEYRLSPILSIVVKRTSNGDLKAKREITKLVTKEVLIGGKIFSSLNRAMAKAKERRKLVSMFVDLFSWDVNWFTDPREGDEFRIIVEKKYNKDKFYQYGKILAAEYKGKVGHFRVFYFCPRGKKVGNYYTPEGRSIRRDFLKLPLNFKRISSRFNKRRFHPVLHRTKGHYGVDYAAARGTPIWAVADAVVLKAGRYGGAGNKIMLKHKNHIVTEYMHLSRFARGIRKGVRVKQRQVIGYVGTTGLSTGPHLHYGVKIRGKYIDPMAFSVGRGELLPRRQRIQFLDQLPSQIAALEGISVVAKN